MASRGPRASRLNPFIKLDDDGRIVTPLPCHECGYLLVGQSIWAQCPECGASIQQSLRHGLPRFAPTHRLETIGHASLALVIGWALMILLGLGAGLVIPASIYFFVGLRKLGVGSWFLSVSPVVALAMAGVAAVVAGLYVWDWWDSYSRWYGYASINDMYYFAEAAFGFAVTLGVALMNFAAGRLAEVCRWPKVRWSARAAALVTLFFGAIAVIGSLLEVFAYGGVFEVWWEFWDDEMGSPTWWALSVISIAQLQCWLRLHRALRQLIAERMQDTSAAA